MKNILKDITSVIIDGRNKEVKDESLMWAEKARYGVDSKKVLDELEKLKAELDKALAPKSEQEIIPKAPDLTKLNYELMSDEQIDELSKTLSGYDESKKEGIARKYDEEQANVLAKKEKTTEQKEQLATESNAMYEELKNRLKEQNARRGLAHSSVAEELKDEKSYELNSEIDSVYSQLDEEIKGYDRKIDSLNAEKMSKLVEYDTEMAVKIEKQKQALIKERQKLQEEMTTYNNKLNEVRDNYEKKKEKAIKDYYSAYYKEKAEREEREQKYGYSGVTEENYKKRLALVDKYTAGLSKREQEQFIKGNSSRLKELLGLYYKDYEDKYIN